MSNKGKFFVISAPSAAGKSTVINSVIEELCFLKKPISYTTRQPRAGEKDGVHYNFISTDKFEKMKKEGKFLEWATVYNNFYATSMDTIKSALKSGIILIKDIDTQGAMQIKEKLGKDAVLIFIEPPSIEELRRRIRGRATDPEQVVKIRLENAKKEMAEADKYDHIVVNDILDDAVGKIKDIISRYIQK